MDSVVAILIGCGVGFLTGLLPGLHVNLLAAVLITTPVASPATALGLLALGTVHTFVNILPGTFLGIPDEDAPLSALPAHRMLMLGSGLQAIRISIVASALAACLVAVLAVPYWFLLVGPFDLITPITAVAPFVLILVPFWLAATEKTRMPWALMVAALAAVLGWLAMGFPLRPVLGASSSLLPLLSGLFGVPTLLWSLRRAGPIPYQFDTSPRPVQTGWPGIKGSMLAAASAVLPGITAAVAASVAMPRGRDPEAAVATLSVVNTAHLGFGILLLAITGDTRSGLASAYDGLNPTGRWSLTPPPSLFDAVLVYLAAGVFGALATYGVARSIIARVHRLPARGLSVAALGFLVGIVGVLTGWTGLLLLAAATAVGLLPLSLGLRRVHLTAALTWPIAWLILS